MTIIYGIKNCDTMKKAFVWLKEAGIDYQFHDYKKEGLTTELLEVFVQQLGWEALINKRGTTWRQLFEEVKNAIDEASAKRIMLDNQSIIKRPLLVHNNHYELGFSGESYQQLFAESL